MAVRVATPIASGMNKHEKPSARPLVHIPLIGRKPKEIDDQLSVRQFCGLLKEPGEVAEAPEESVQ
eukprot:99968-Lingulodinium_polyedra.AAC.1